MLRLFIATGALALAVNLHAQTPTTIQGHPPIEAPAPPEAATINKSLLRYVEDDAPVRGENENHEEALAYDYIVRFASGVPTESFRAAARNDLTFAHLMGPEAAKYRGEVVRIEGRLKRVRDLGPTPSLEADGIKHLYEGWIFSEIYREYAHCVLFTELPPEIPVSEQLDRRVSFEGYFYKIYRYRAGDGVRRSPLLVGRTLSLLPKPVSSQSIWEVPGTLIPVTVGLCAAGAAGLFGLIWWYRRSDRLAREALQRARGLTDDSSPIAFHESNPFDGSPSLN